VEQGEDEEEGKEESVEMAALEKDYEEVGLDSVDDDEVEGEEEEY